MSIKEQIEAEAIAWANQRCPEQGPEFIVWCMCRDDYVAGALRAMRWCLERWQRAHSSGKTLSFEEFKAALVARVELAEAANEVLGE